MYRKSRRTFIYFHKVFVEQSWRRKGIGSSLFEILLKAIDALKVDCFLTVDPVNEADMKLYAKWGFKEKALINAYYRPNEDRYVLTRRYKA